MARSKIFEDILNSITPEMEEKWKQERIEEKKSLTLEFQLGYFVGELISINQLPTLSTDHLQSRYVIEVSDEDTKENKRLEDEWFFSNEDEKDGKWDLYHQHNKMLEKKYLPNPYSCHFTTLNVENIEEFKKGLINSLWNCDMCSYSLKPEDIKIYDDDDVRFTIIEFILP